MYPIDEKFRIRGKKGYRESSALSNNEIRTQKGKEKSCEYLVEEQY